MPPYCGSSLDHSSFQPHSAGDASNGSGAGLQMQIASQIDDQQDGRHVPH